jgi:GrpB-like predicted nucleotidyltransferase (UPF0157 family)
VTRHPATQVVEYDPSWVDAFDQVREYVWPAVQQVAIAVEHVGSTAVPGLAAKPVLDVDVVVADVTAVSAAVAALARIGYVHQGDLGIQGREAFTSPAGLPENHLYVVVSGSQAHLDHVHLRDYLRIHPEEVRRYADEKRRLARLLPTDRRAYVNGKASLVQEMLTTSRRG